MCESRSCASLRHARMHACWRRHDAGSRPPAPHMDVQVPRAQDAQERPTFVRPSASAALGILPPQHFHIHVRSPSCASCARGIRASLHIKKNPSGLGKGRGCANHRKTCDPPGGPKPKRVSPFKDRHLHVGLPTSRCPDLAKGLKTVFSFQCSVFGCTRHRSVVWHAIGSSRWLAVRKQCPRHRHPL